MNAKCSILSLALLAAWLSAAGTEPTNVVVHWQSTSPSGASRIATAAYYDGLGRHVASVAEDASPDGGDIVEIKEYDAAGRPFRQWLPAPVAAFEAGALESVKEAAETFYGDSIPYAETAYEQSALSRPVEAWGAGEAWRGALRPVRTAYTLNSTGKDMRCMMLSVGDGGELVKEQQHYPAGRLDVTLTLDGNRVVKAVDEAPQVAYGDCFHFAGGNGSDDADDYLYDANGNLAADRNKGIASIEYDAANLPEKVTFEGSRFSLAYLYDAEGRKLRASYGMFASQRPDTAATVVPVFPVRPMAEAQPAITLPGTWRRDYCGNVIYKDGQIERILTPEGYAVPDGGGWKRYVYVRDVQGNIRAVVGENNAVAEQTDYYPYGMPMADVNSSSAQPFKFGGKELEREGGADFYDFEARRLDFAIGRFTSPDPLCEQTPEVSPYAYCAADPVNFIDPTGMTIEYGDSVTDEQRNMLEQYRQEMSKSLLFKMIYDFLNSEETGIFTINFGNIESPGQFVEGDIIYRKNSHGTNLYYMVFVEEIIHAFQYAHGQMDDPSINKEYEARLLTMWVLREVKTLAPSVEGCLGKYLDQIYSGRLVGIGNPELLRTEYQEYGKMFVDYFKRTYPTDANYHVPANEPSRLFISIFQFLFNKILKTCRY